MKEYNFSVVEFQQKSGISMKRIKELSEIIREMLNELKKEKSAYSEYDGEMDYMQVIAAAITTEIMTPLEGCVFTYGTGVQAGANFYQSSSMI